MKQPADMTAGEINKALDKLDVESSALNRAFIDADRGYEKPDETFKLSDPLAVRAIAQYERRVLLVREIERRYGPGAPRRLPHGRGFGPIKTGRY